MPQCKQHEQKKPKLQQKNLFSGGYIALYLSYMSEMNFD
jgi:hypothetical protein